MWWWLVLWALAGCDRVFGITTYGPLGPPPPDAVDAAGPMMVTGRFVQHWVENDPDGLPTIQQRTYPTDQLTASVKLDDGTSAIVTFGTGGTFSFPLAHGGQSYALTIVTPIQSLTWASNAPVLQLVERIPGGIDGQLPASGTKLDMTVNSRPTSSGKEEIDTIGRVWTRNGVTLGAAIDLTWTRPLLAGHDGAYYILSENNVSYARVTHAAPVHDAVMMNGATTSFNTIATAVGLTRCAHVVANTADELQRLMTLLPGMQGSVEGWLLEAVPGTELALAVGAPVANALTLTNYDGNVNYGTPYGNMPIALVTSQVVAQASASCSSSIAVPVASDCSIPTTIPDALVAVPTMVTLAGTPLDATNKIVPLGGAKADLMFTPAQGSADLYAIELDDLSGGTPVKRNTLLTTKLPATLDSSLLQFNGTYQVTIDVYMGVPDAAVGDFITTSGPMGLISLKMPPFRIQ